MRKIDQQRLDELTEWCRNKPEKAARRILELESDTQVGFKGNSPIEALPALPDRSLEFSYPECVFCKTVHPPSMECPRYWMNQGVYSAV